MAHTQRSHRPVFWVLFGTGGFLVAFFYPIHILLSGLLQPLRLVPSPDRSQLLTLLENPLTRIYLAALLIFAIWHAAYRIRDTLCDLLGIRPLDEVVMGLCYIGASAVTVAVGWLLIFVP